MFFLFMWLLYRVLWVMARTDTFDRTVLARRFCVLWIRPLPRLIGKYHPLPPPLSHKGRREYRKKIVFALPVGQRDSRTYRFQSFVNLANNHKLHELFWGLGRQPQCKNQASDSKKNRRIYIFQKYLCETALRAYIKRYNCTGVSPSMSVWYSL